MNLPHTYRRRPTGTTCRDHAVPAGRRCIFYTQMYYALVMRFSFLISFILIIIIVIGFWFKSTAMICPAPLSYKIGEVDTSFDLSLDEAKERVQLAEKQWEEAINRELFVYDDEAEFTVNFIFDERQAKSNAEEQERRFLDGQLAENEELFEVVDIAQKEYDNLASSYQARVNTYESRLSKYNETVQKYNDRGGAPEEEFETLEEERRALNREAEDLSSMVNQLNNLANQINELSTEGNRLINAYNGDVEDYNQNYGFAREFTQGDYEGSQINIYEFSSNNELQAVLLHEFGHALGIDHVEASSSVMYYLLEDNNVRPLFSAEDLTAFYEVCGTGKEWDHQLRKIVRNLLTAF